jgi:hypothetical protein
LAKRILTKNAGRRRSSAASGNLEMEHGFSTQLVEIIFASDLSCAKLLQPVRFQSSDGRLYEIPYACPTDFASTPPATWGAPLFLIPTGWWAIPAMGHDAAFKNLLLVVNADGSKQRAFPGAGTEGACNALLLEMMQAIKPNPTVFEKAQMDAIYEGVTIGGFHSYKVDRT